MTLRAILSQRGVQTPLLYKEAGLMSAVGKGAKKAFSILDNIITDVLPGRKLKAENKMLKEALRKKTKQVRVARALGTAGTTAGVVGTYLGFTRDTDNTGR